MNIKQWFKTFFCRSRSLPELTMFWLLLLFLPVSSSFAANNWITVNDRTAAPAMPEKKAVPPKIITLEDEKKHLPQQHFYSLQVDPVGNSLFIVDCSASMRKKNRKNPTLTKLDILSRELKNILLADSTTSRQTGGFVIISFGAVIECFPQDGLMPYTEGSVPKLTARGATPIKQAWLKALNIIDADKIDTVYFMTDGNPSDKFTTQWLKQKLKKEKYPQLRINCICLGKDRYWMKDLARYYSGKYVCIP